MKVGDTVWFWSAVAYQDIGAITSGVVVDDSDPNFISIKIEDKTRPCVIWRFEVFPTREALCEHYRKVFE